MVAYEGSLHIVLSEPESPTKPATYEVTFAPSQISGGALKRVLYLGEEKLKQFLAEIGVPPETIIATLDGLRKTQSYSIEHVKLTDTQLEHYGLGWTTFTENVRAYLGALSS